MNNIDEIFSSYYPKLRIYSRSFAVMVIVVLYAIIANLTLVFPFLNRLEVLEAAQ